MKLSFFRTGPFFKIGDAGGKELRWLVRYIAVAAKWIFRLRESFIPRTDPNRTRKAGRKEEGREYLFTRMERGRRIWLHGESLRD